jgi:hypothetical protein
MVFLNPSILLGLLAAAIPILIHILNFRKLQKVEFSTLSFLKELQKSKIKKIKLKQWLLLLLRTLIIIFIILAFARPTLENVSIAGGASTAKSSSLFILDNSFSMSYVGDDGSNFNKSKKIAKNIISKMHEGDDIIILKSTDSVLTTSSQETATKFIDDLSITSITESTNSKLLKAIDILNQSNNINKEIFILSDLQETTLINKNSNDSLSKQLTDNKIKLYSFDMSSDNVNNYSVSNLSLLNSIIELNKPLTFSVAFSNYSDLAINNIALSLFVNDKRVAQQSVSLNEKSDKIIYFETSLNSTGLIEARIEAEEDNIVQDNISYLSFIVPKKIKVLMLYEDITDLSFIESAVSSISDQISITKQNILGVLNNRVTNFDLIFYVGTKVNKSLDIANYLIEGGGLIFIPPKSVSENSLVELSKIIGLPKVKDIINSKPSQGNYAEFGKIDFEHPIFQNLFEKQTKKQIETADLFKYIKFEEPINAKSIIRLIDKSTFLGEYNFQKGKVLYLNSAVNLDWSNLAIKGIFAPLISRMVFYLTSANENLQTYTTGDLIPVRIDKLTFPLVEVFSPNGEDKINLQNNSSDILNYNFTSTPGIYNFYNNGDLLSTISVNVDRRESNLTKIDNNTLEAFYENLFSNNYLTFNSDENYLEQISQARFGTELWKYFIIIVILLSLIEMYVARSTKKDIMTLDK